MDSVINFTVQLRPSLPEGNYTIIRSIQIDPNQVWVNYGQEVVGTADVRVANDESVVGVIQGALIIQTKLGLTDEETAAQIQENPYLQYFLRYESYRDEKPFDSSMMVYFRKRLKLKELSEINELIHGKYRKKSGSSKDKEDPGGSAGGRGNQGKLIVDASCAPADIRYPTDLSLLNEAREKSEHIIDRLHEPLKGKEKKVCTYRKKARRDYLKAAKRRKLSAKELRKAIGKQLRYLKRDLEHIHGPCQQKFFKTAEAKRVSGSSGHFRSVPTTESDV